MRHLRGKSPLGSSSGDGLLFGANATARRPSEYFSASAGPVHWIRSMALAHDPPGEFNRATAKTNGSLFRFPVPRLTVRLLSLLGFWPCRTATLEDPVLHTSIDVHHVRHL